MKESRHLPKVGFDVQVDLRRLSQAIAALGFLLLFPGYAVYHYLAASGWSQLFLGGLYGFVSLGLAIYCCAFSFWLLRSRVLGGMVQAQLFIVSWVFLLAWTFVGYLGIVDEPHGLRALREAVSTLIIWLAAFFVGSFYQANTTAQRIILLGCAVALVAILLHAMVVHGSLLGPLMVFAAGDPDAQTSTYQGVGRSIMVTAIVLSSLCAQRWKQLVVLFLAVLALVALGSRAHLFTTLVLIVATLLLSALSTKRRLALVLFTLVTATVVWLGWSVFLSTRAAEILDLSVSTSWQTRLELQSIALDVIRTSPVLGDFGYHLRGTGLVGYAHNALSAWTEFGLAGFLLYCLLIVYFTLLSFEKFISPRSSSASWRIAFSLNLASLVLAISAEAVFSAIPALGWGFAVNALIEERRRRGVVVEPT
jgi:hypothetical protein